MMNKRWMCFSLMLTTAALLCLLVPQRAQAAEAAQEAAITIEFDREQYAPGETANVQICVAAVDSAIDLSGLEFQLSAADGLELQTLTMALGGSSPADDTSTGVSDASAASGRGVYCQYGAEALTVDKTGVLVAEARYLVTGQPGATMELGLDEWMLLQSDGTEIPAGQQSGEAFILPDTDPDAPTLALFVDHPVCIPGDIVTVTLCLIGAEESFSIYALEDTITFDPTCFRLDLGSIDFSIGNASGKMTGDVYDRVRFDYHGLDAATVREGAPLLTFQLKVLKGGAICNTRVKYYDADSKELPLNLQDTAVSLYDLEHQPPLAWIKDGTALVLRNYSDDSVTASVWLVRYGPEGQMRSAALLSQQTLTGGARITVPREDIAVSPDETAKLLVTGDAFTPLTQALDVK